MNHHSSRNIWCWICQYPYPHQDINSSIHCPLLDIHDPCFVDSVTTVLSICFILVLSTTILTIWFCTKYSGTRYLKRLPGHQLRYLLTVIGVLILIACATEGVLSDRLAAGRVMTRPHLYLPFVFSAISLVLTIVYYHHIESYQLSENHLFLLFLYWLLFVAAEVVRFINFHALTRDSFNIVRFDLNCALLTTYALLLLIESCRFLKQVCCRSSRQRWDERNHGSHDVDSDMLYLHDDVNCLSSYTFGWFRWLLRVGYRKPVEMKDLGSLPSKHCSLQIHRRFRNFFLREMERSRQRGSFPSLWRVIFNVHGVAIFGSGVLKLLADLAEFVGPFLIQFIVQYVADEAAKDDDTRSVALPPTRTITPELITVTAFFSNGFVLVGATIVAGVIHFLCDQYHTYMCLIISVHVRTAVQTIIYDKSLCLSTYTLSGGSMTIGHVTNHMSTDAMNLLFYLQKMHYIWAIPLQILVSLGLLYNQIGPSSFLSFAVFVTVMPLQLILAKIMASVQKQAMRYADDRLKRSNELLQGIKLLKLYGWEKMFCWAVEQIRRIEMRKILKYNSCYGINVIMCQTVPVLVSLVAFATYPYLIKQPLTPGVTFTSLALMNMLIDPLYLLPLAISLLVNAIVSAHRISAFFLAPEVERAVDVDIIPDQEFHADESDHFNTETQSHASFSGVKGMAGIVLDDDEETDEDTAPLLPGASSVQTEYDTSHSILPDSYLTSSLSPAVAVEIKNGFFSWETDGLFPVISELNIAIPAGKLTVVVGSIGSGKSSLLEAVFGEMTTLSGTIQINRCLASIAYSSQKAWIVNASLRDNIIFGQPFDINRYKRVISACALQPDIDILPGGELTEIGEKGINLSGGQKQRLSVARAMYSKNCIVLLDDPMSALDVHVGGHLFYEGILGMMLREEKRTVVLVTHQLQYLQLADLILVLKDGKVTNQGTFEDICDDNQYLQKLWSHEIGSDRGRAQGNTNSESDSDGTAEVEGNLLRQRERLQAHISEGRKNSNFGQDSLIAHEELQRGSMSCQVYLYYLQSMGWPLVILVVMTYGYSIGLGIYKNFFLSTWSKAGVNASSIADANTLYYIKGYSLLSGLCIFGMVVTMCTVTAAFVQAANRLHLNMLRKIFCSPIRFFDTTPIGRILNRMSSDTHIIDIKLMNTAENMAYYFQCTVSALIVNAIIAPEFAAELLPVLVFYYCIQKYFLTTSRELQRLDSVTKSPVFAHFSETLAGLSTIRAYKVQRRLFSTLLSRIDENNTAYLYLQTGYSWLEIVLNSTAILVVLMAGITTVIKGIVGSIEPSEVGLALSYALMVSTCLNKMLRFTADTEMQMNPVERVHYYTQLPSESYDGVEPPNDWPNQGNVLIEGMSARYATDLNHILRDVSVHFHPGEKVGVCGRTGSGKSSLTLALFRLIDICKGRIMIDGYDIADIPVMTLRQKLSIIPQDPVLFTGSIRSNLDPESVRSDSQLWHALEIAQLKDIVAQLPEKLDSMVSEGGENYSVGQRQLFCLARAFLRNSRILIMDEATASIDTETEKVLQMVVTSAFADKTVITIAHRVSTILKSDTILVLSDGLIIEHDSPGNLMRRESVFASLVMANK